MSYFKIHIAVTYRLYELIVQSIKRAASARLSVFRSDPK